MEKHSFSWCPQIRRIMLHTWTVRWNEQTIFIIYSTVLHEASPQTSEMKSMTEQQDCNYYHILILIRLARVRTCVRSQERKMARSWLGRKLLIASSSIISIKNSITTRRFTFRSNFYSLRVWNENEMKRDLTIALYVNICTMTAIDQSIILRVIEGIWYCASHLFRIEEYYVALNVT